MKIPLRQYWALLHNYLKPQWGQVLLLALFILGHIGLRLLNPQIMRFFIDTAVGGGALQTLINVALLFFGVALLSQGLSIINTYLGQNIAWTATNDLRLDLLLHCLRLDQSFHKAHTPGELLERIDGDVNTLANFFSHFAIRFLGNALLMLGILTLLLLEDWRIGTALSLFAILALVIMIRVRSFAGPYWIKVREISASFYGFLGEQLTGTEDIRANGARGYVLHRFDTLMQTWFKQRVRANMASNVLWGTNILIFALGNAVAYALSAYLWQNNIVTIGTVYLIFHYTDLLQRPMREIRTQLEDLQRADAGIKRIGDLMQIESKLPDTGNGRLTTGALAVTFHDVTFGYQDAQSATDGSDLVLQNLNFQVAPGRILGVLGRTGSGKTTVARLLLRLYDPQDGSILLGNTASTTVPLATLRQRVGMVTQDVQLFQATIRDNLTFFNTAITDDDITAVLTDLGLATWLQTQPAGLDSLLNGNGAGVSAGQAQLLAFARVFLADPGLVILDEASSRLDPATEHLIEQAISKLLTGRTGIIIAHHLATVQRADDILILENGRILEYGERIQLMNNPQSHFSHLLQTGLEEVLA